MIKMKEENSEDVGATAFDLKNSQHPDYENKINKVKEKVQKQRNSRIELPAPSKIMNQVLYGK